MNIKVFFERVLNRKIKLRGKDFLYFFHSDGEVYRICIEHLLKEPNDFVIYTETIINSKEPKAKIEIVKRQNVLRMLLIELESLEFKFLVDSSVPPNL